MSPIQSAGSLIPARLSQNFLTINDSTPGLARNKSQEPEVGENYCPAVATGDSKFFKRYRPIFYLAVMGVHGSSRLDANVFCYRCHDKIVKVINFW